jgi:tetratricopeptide (TPR) repeat protein
MADKGRAPVQGNSPQLTPQEAITYYERAIKEDPNNADNFAELGAAYYIAHDWDQAITALERAVQLQANHGHAHYYLGVLYAAKGDRERAEREMNTVLQVSDNPILKAQAKSRIPAIQNPSDLSSS